jgi:mRNA interferase HicA
MCCRIDSSKQRGGALKFSEFRRWLKAHGVTFEAGKGSHFKVTALKGNKTTFADHCNKEMPEPIRKAIIKQLGL